MFLVTASGACLCVVTAGIVLWGCIFWNLLFWLMLISRHVGVDGMLRSGSGLQLVGDLLLQP